MIPEKYLSQEREIFNDVWKFRKDFFAPDGFPAFFEEMTKECDRISKKHGSKFCDALLFACIQDVENRKEEPKPKPVDELEDFPWETM